MSSNNYKPLKSTILLPVFVPAVVLTLLLVIFTISHQELAGNVFSSMLAFLTETFGWFYMLAVASFLVFIIGIAVSRWGNIKLGPDHAKPKYSFPVWFAMLFSAGYGIALLFFGVAEPVLHYAAPPEGAAETVDAAKQAMQIAYFHWGFHIWAIYGLVGLVLAYFAFRHGLPLSMRSTLYPLIGDRIHGPIGHVIDLFAILATLFGIATTLGLSVTQINAGLHYLWPAIPVSAHVQVAAIATITGLAIISVVAGLDKGIKRLSIVNMILAVSLMLFVFMVGPSIHILETFLQNTGSYLNGIIERTFNLQAYSRSDWIGNWTLFIFGWTIAWAPFVGLFIAKISHGRTIREFVFGVLLVPTLFTFLWFSIFGDTALHLIMTEGYHSLITDVQEDHAIALFKLYETLPFTSVVSFITVFLIITFFVTSSDSGSLVVDTLASGGAPTTPVWQRIFWASLEGALAAGLLLAGGLSALQTMSITSALPFAIIMVLSMIGLWRALVIEGYRQSSLKQPGRYQGGSSRESISWKKRLSRILDYPGIDDVSQFIEKTAFEAIQEVANTLQEQGWQVTTLYNKEQMAASLSIKQGDDLDFLYEVRPSAYVRPGFAFPNVPSNHDHDEYYRAEVFLRRGGQSYDIYDHMSEDVINDILDQFERYINFRQLSPESLPWKMNQEET